MHRATRLLYIGQPCWNVDEDEVLFGIATQHEHMANMLTRLIGTLSFNDHTDFRRIFADYHIETTDIRYTVGGGKGPHTKEVLIFSWDVDAEPAGLF